MLEKRNKGRGSKLFAKVNILILGSRFLALARSAGIKKQEKGERVAHESEYLYPRLLILSLVGSAREEK